MKENKVISLEQLSLPKGKMSRCYPKTCIKCLVLLFLITILGLQVSRIIELRVAPEVMHKLQNLNVRDALNSIHFNSPEEPDDLPPCGEICSYDVFDSQAYPGRYYPLLKKSVDCTNILTRMSLTQHLIHHHPRPHPPDNLLKDFTQDGVCPLTGEHAADAYLEDEDQYDTQDKKILLRKDIDELIKNNRNEEHISPFLGGDVLSQTVDDYIQWIDNKRGFILSKGTQWAEVILLRNNATSLTTIKYDPAMNIQHPYIDMKEPTAFANQYLEGRIKQFDFGVSLSTVEYLGLGKYGRKADPFGDLEAVAQAWCITRPGGLFILALPMSGADECAVEWRGQRLYSTQRLEHLTANWNILDLIPYPDDEIVVIVMSKPLKS